VTSALDERDGARGGRDRPPAAIPSERRLIAVLIGLTMVVGIISSLGAPLIPDVARAWHVSLAAAQWSLTAALLASAVAAPVLGRLGDGRWRREAIVLGLMVVMAGSLLAAVTHTLAVLIVGRAMQGTGLALAPLTIAAARDHLSPRSAPGVIALLSVAGASAVGAGYPISGLIATEWGVHAAFFFGAVICALAAVAGALVVPSVRRAAHAPLDVRGALVGACGLIALLLAIGQGEEWGWGSPPIILLALGAIVTLAVWARWQLRRATPLVDLRQLRLRPVLTADLAGVALGIALYMFLTLVTEFVQEPRSAGYGLGASSLTAGLALVPFSVLSVVASRISSRFIPAVAAPRALVGGSLVISASGVFYALLHGAVWEAFVTMGGVGVGFGLTFAAIPGMIARAVATGTGSAIGLYQVSRSIGFSIGSALAASILAGSLLPGTGQVGESGFVNGLWVGASICALSATASWLLAGRQATTAGGALVREPRLSAGNGAQR
jgi:MFS family permease